MQKYFKDIITLKRGFDLPESKRINGEFDVYSSNGIAGTHNNFKINAPSVITGRSGSLGTVQYANKNCWPLNTTLYVSDFKGNIPKYIYYLLQSLHLEKYGSGSAVPTLNRNHLDNLIVNIHNIDFQQHIVDIIGSIDDKIESNNKMIEKILEFGDLKYNNINPIYDKFINYARFLKGKEASAKNYSDIKYSDYINYIRVKDLNANTNTYIPNNLNIPVAEENDILISFDGAIGRINIGLTGAYSSGVYKVIAKNVKNFGILFWSLRSDKNQNIMLEHTNGTTILHGSKCIDFLVIKQHNDIQIKYFNNIFDYIVSIKNENIKLNELKQLYLKKFFG